MKKIGLAHVTFVALFAVGLAFFAFGDTKDNQVLQAPYDIFRRAAAEKAFSLTVVGAKNCKPCKKLKPHIEKLIKEGYLAVYIDVRGYEGPEKITRVPTLLFFDKNGKVIKKEYGYRDYKYLASKLKKAVEPG